MTYRSLIPVVAALLCTIAMPVRAQERTGGSYSTEASITYSVLRDVGETGKTGMAMDFGKQLAHNVSVVGEIAFNHFASMSETYRQFSGGVRYGAVTGARMRPFAQVLFGVQREFGSNGFNVQPGGGLNIRVAGRIDGRVQVDVPLLRWEGDTYRQFRFTAGIGLPLGR